MTKASITFDFKSYWHMGSGRGEGASLDAVVVRSPEGLPVIPGKTVKGLLREAVSLMEECGNASLNKKTELWFGPDTQPGRGITRYEGNPGALRFTSAQLSEGFRAWASCHAEEAEFLYVALSATKIDDNGLAQDKSLRRIEACIPLELTAYVESIDEKNDWISQLAESAKFIRSAGTHRHRGLGRVKVTVEKVTV